MTFHLPLHVETLGRPQGPGVDTFLLIHGFGASAFSWRYWAPRLAERGHVVLVDLKGFGSAPRPDDGRYGPHDHAELVHRLILQRDLRELTIVGHSLGGGISLLTALRLLDGGDTGGSRERLKRLVVVAGAAYPQKLPPFVPLARWPGLMSLAMRVVGARRIVRGVLRHIVYDAAAIHVGQVEGYAYPLGEKGALPALFNTARQVVPPDLERIALRYPELDVPALLVWGADDKVIPLWVGERLDRDLPRSTLVVLERCGHLPAEERWEDGWKAVAAFLDDSAPATPPPSSR
ncbi:MAG: alpha/beta hydrolase [Gemmatimonadota bacterium]|nr:alpha/beta hydrolase [Gemmatimonadota bacterium]MDH5759511.1 alpha/beta hydrolase [Gemmatimonadota bacterium]